MATLTRTEIFARARLLVEAEPLLQQAIDAAETGNRDALSYLRTCVTPVESLPTPPWVEDGPCAGYGCGAVLICDGD